MSAKNRDNKKRWRNITVGFRVSPEENERTNKAVALSGLPQQEYCYRHCQNQDVVLQDNSSPVAEGEPIAFELCKENGFHWLGSVIMIYR